MSDARASGGGQRTSLDGTDCRADRIALELEAGMSFAALTTTQMVIIIAAVVILVAGLATMLVRRRRRTDRLRSKFGGV